MASFPLRQSVRHTVGQRTMPLLRHTTELKELVHVASRLSTKRFVTVNSTCRVTSLQPFDLVCLHR